MTGRFDNWIHNTFAFSSRGLALYRVFFALYVLLVIMPGVPPYLSYGFLGSLPDDLFFPPVGPMMLFSGFPSPFIIALIEAGIILSLLCLLVGWKTKWVSIAAGLLILTGNGFSYSLGKINHDLILPLVPLVMSFSNWGAAWSVDALKKQTPKIEQWPVTLLALLLGFMMFTAGFPKILGGWHEFSTQATYGHLMNQHFVNYRTDLLSSWFLTFESRFFWISLDYLTIIFEIGFLVAVIHRKAVRFFAALAVMFHFSVMIMLNISFIPNLAAYSLFLFNWNDYARNLAVLSLMNRFKAGFLSRLWLFIPGVVIAASFFVYIGSPVQYLNDLYPLQSDLLFYEVVVLTLFVPFALLRIYEGISDLVSSQFMKKKPVEIGTEHGS